MTNAFIPPRNPPPKVLVLAGLDPSGGAGLQADIVTCAYFGCHPLPIMTANTIQDTANIYGFKPEDSTWIVRQLQHLIADITPDVIKIGALGCGDLIAPLCNVLRQLPCKIIYDPVLRAGGGGHLSDERLVHEVRQNLLPITYLCTPNTPELHALSGVADETAAINHLIGAGCRHVLVTGGHDQGERRSNRLYDGPTLRQQWFWERIAGEYRGTGCSLSTAIAALMANGNSLANSCEQAMAYLSASVEQAYSIGSSQRIPLRLIRQIT